MTEAVAVNAAARVRQLTDLTNRLTASLTEESRAFEARRPQDAAASLAGTQDLANAYRRESAQIKANPAAIAAAPAADRTAL
ncbi:MAG: flagellar basal-body protein FlbY, partial [Brevundimonas sp.]|nr:flagellar basal-body protein FlbY [Brevundimonas sp.]